MKQELGLVGTGGEKAMVKLVEGRVWKEIVVVGMIEKIVTCELSLNSLVVAIVVLQALKRLSELVKLGQGWIQ